MHLQKIKKAFMVEHEYSDAKAALFVTDAELKDFRNTTLPWLEKQYDTASAESVWQESGIEELQETMLDVSITSMLIDSLELLDLLFLFLGLSTAFQLGRAGRGS
jgi:hypothetical protein